MPSVRFDAEARSSAFASTRWTIVLEAGKSHALPEHALGALSGLCPICWHPVFYFLRRQGSA